MDSEDCFGLVYEDSTFTTLRSLHLPESDYTGSVNTFHDRSCNHQLLFPRTLKSPKHEHTPCFASLTNSTFLCTSSFLYLHICQERLDSGSYRIVRIATALSNNEAKNTGCDWHIKTGRCSLRCRCLEREGTHSFKLR